MNPDYKPLFFFPYSFHFGNENMLWLVNVPSFARSETGAAGGDVVGDPIRHWKFTEPEMSSIIQLNIFPVFVLQMKKIKLQ